MCIRDRHWNVNFGADGPGASGIVYLAIATEDAQNPLVQAINPASGSSINVIIDGVNYGTLTFKADGTYTFQAQPEAQGTIYIALGAPDGDGDIGYSENDNGFVLNIGQSEPPVYEDYYFGQVTFDEANLAAGSSPDASALEKALSLPAGFKVLTDDWDELADGRFELAGDGVVLRYDSASNSLVCVLTDALAHEGQGRDSLEFELPAFSLVDANGNERNAYVPVTVKDDAPEAAIYGPDGAVSGSVEFGDTYTGRWDFEFGADGSSDVNGGFMVQV